MLDDEFDKLTQRESYALCLNRRLAPHRIILISWLFENNLFDKTKTSYDIELLHRDDQDWIQYLVVVTMEKVTY